MTEHRVEGPALQGPLEEIPAGRPEDNVFTDPFGDQGETAAESPHPLADEFCDRECCAMGGCLSGRLWFRGEFLLWRVQGFSVPPLVTTSPAGTSRDAAGVLGQPGTTILLGNSELIDEVSPGGRVSLVYWLDPCQIHGIEAAYFALGSSDFQYRAESQGDPILARPFNNVEPGSVGPDSELIAFPNLLQGNIQVQAKTSFEGAEVLYRRALIRDCVRRVDCLVGWRCQRLSEDLVIRDAKTSVGEGTGLVPGTRLEEFDSFTTSNVFQGAEVGLVAERRWRAWTLELCAKMALGNTHSRVSIDGSTTVTVPVPGGAPDVAVTPAGLLAQQTNIGTYDDNQLAVIPEVSLTVGYNITRHLRATAGYTFLYWSTVARPGDQIDTSLNLSQLNEDGLVGPARPRFAWLDTGLWVQGLNVGLDYRF